MAKTIVVIDDDSDISNLVGGYLKAAGFDTFQANNGQSGLKLVQQQQPNVAIVDIEMPGMSGIETLREIRLLDSSIAVIIMTGNDTTDNTIEAMRSGAFDFISKPFDILKLKEIVDKALVTNQLNRKVRVLNKDNGLDKSVSNEDLMIGSSPEMVEIWKMVGKVADSTETILISGESGTGKELLARAIYNHSNRKGKPFMAVNCAALPETLLESELFGHEKGSFTDAHTRKIGKFEQCHGGTLFLDEISELSLLNQSKLLRVLESQSFMRVGGNREINVDVRVIAATNKKMIQEVKDGNFRLDLFYRLKVINFFLPPLRDRISDIPLLIDLFIDKCASKAGKKIFGITPEALQFLTTYNWQGNVRELKNAISSAVVLVNGQMLQLEDFSTLADQNSQKDAASGWAGDFNRVLVQNFPEACQENAGNILNLYKEELERSLVHLALSYCQDSQVSASKLLGTSRNTLRKILERESAKK